MAGSDGGRWEVVQVVEGGEVDHFSDGDFADAGFDGGLSEVHINVLEIAAVALLASVSARAQLAVFAARLAFMFFGEEESILALITVAGKGTVARHTCIFIIMEGTSTGVFLHALFFGN